MVQVQADDFSEGQLAELFRLKVQICAGVLLQRFDFIFANRAFNVERDSKRGMPPDPLRRRRGPKGQTKYFTASVSGQQIIPGRTRQPAVKADEIKCPLRNSLKQDHLTACARLFRERSLLDSDDDGKLMDEVICAWDAACPESGRYQGQAIVIKK